jgi:hypothetical protein
VEDQARSEKGDIRLEHLRNEKGRDYEIGVGGGKKGRQGAQNDNHIKEPEEARRVLGGKDEDVEKKSRGDNRTDRQVGNEIFEQAEKKADANIRYDQTGEASPGYPDPFRQGSRLPVLQGKKTGKKEK